MNRFRIVYSAVHAGIAALCYVVLKHLNEIEAYVTSWRPFLLEYRGVTIPVLIALLALLFRVSDKLSHFLLEGVWGFSALLRRALAGRGHVEGDWPLVVIDMERDRLLYLGFLNIGFENGQIYVKGDDWREDGTHAHAFHSVQSRLADDTLKYWYEQGASLHKPDMRGYTEIYFFPRGERLQRHAGKFLDPKHTTDIRFYAVRRRYGFFERRLSSKEDKLAAARELWMSLQPRLAALKAADISTDFE